MKETMELDNWAHLNLPLKAGEIGAFSFRSTAERSLKKKLEITESKIRNPPARPRKARKCTAGG